MLTSRGNRISIWIFVLVALISPQLFSQNIRFAAPLAIPFPSQRSYAPAALTTGDVNEDGNTDLLFFSQGFDSARAVRLAAHLADRKRDR